MSVWSSFSGSIVTHESDHISVKKLLKGLLEDIDSGISVKEDCKQNGKIYHSVSVSYREDGHASEVTKNTILSVLKDHDISYDLEFTTRHCN